MDGGALLATIHGVAKSRIRLSDFIITITTTISHKKEKIRQYYLLVRIQRLFLDHSCQKKFPELNVILTTNLQEIMRERNSLYNTMEIR